MLADKALLIYVNISQWTGRKLDRKATATVAQAHSTNAEAGNYTKKLLPGSKELDRVSAQAGRIRKFFYERTLPWFSDGARIIKGDAYMEFMNEFRKMKSEYDAAVSDFISVYPSLQVQSRFNLGNLYDSAEYPDATQLQKKFQCAVKVMPLPDVSDFRIDVEESEKRQFIETMESVQREAMQDCWNRLYDVVKTAAEKLATPDARFKNSLLDNVIDLCQLLPKLNVTDDPQLEAKRLEVESLISKMSPDVLRDNVNERQDAAAKLNEITKAMGAFMGAPNDTDLINSKVVTARLNGARFEDDPAANLASGIIITGE